MTYSAGGLIEATDYNGFVSTNAGANVNVVWGTGASDAGYGQTALATVSVGGTVTATQWASLVNTITSMANHQGTTITARTAPVAGNTIAILSALNTDLTNCYNNRGNAVANGSQYVTWSGNSAYTAGNWTTTRTFTHTITWADASSARYFFNAGGRIKWEVNKSSTGNTGDPEWNDLATTLCGDIYITGGTATQTISGTAYTGTTKSGGTGTPTTLATTTGWFDLTGSPTTIYQQNADSAPYTGNYIRLTAAQASAGTQLVLTTTWVNTEGDTVSAGTNTASPFSSFGTAPATVVTYFPPSTTYLTTASWGTPTIAATAT